MPERVFMKKKKTIKPEHIDKYFSKVDLPVPRVLRTLDGLKGSSIDKAIQVGKYRISRPLYKVYKAVPNYFKEYPKLFKLMGGTQAAESLMSRETFKNGKYTNPAKLNLKSGGPFQITEGTFNDINTLDAQKYGWAKPMFTRLEKTLNFDRNKVDYKDLRSDPYLSAAYALMLYTARQKKYKDRIYSNSTSDISTKTMGNIWKKYFNTKSGAGTVPEFIERYTHFYDKTK